MTFNPVPFAVKGGLHSERVLRRFANIATRDAEGVALPGDLKVRPLDVSGAGVQIDDGGMGILNRSIATGGETYIGSNEGPQTIGVASTGSSPRVDLIIARVVDPNESGSVPAPASPTLGPFLIPEVISGVDPSITEVQQIPQYASLSAITLARISQPVGSGAITAAMITDLRKLIGPRSDAFPLMGGTVADVSLTSATMIQWPSTRRTLDIPDWATELSVLASINSVGVVGNAGASAGVAGELAVVVGPNTGTQWRSSETTYDEDTNGTGRRTGLQVGGLGPIPASMRGKSADIRIEAKRRASTAGGLLRTLAGTHVTFAIYYRETVT